MLAQTLSKRKKKPSPTRTNSQRPAIVPDAVYSRPQASQLLGVAEITLIRAYSGGHLAAHKIGTKIRHTGRQLLTWIEAGGKTTPKRKSTRK